MFSKKFFSQIVNTVSMVTAAYFAGSAAYLFCCVPGIRSIVIFIQLIGIMFTFIMWYCLREWLNERAVFSCLNQQKADIALCLTVYSSGVAFFHFWTKAYMNLGSPAEEHMHYTAMFCLGGCLFFLAALSIVHHWFALSKKIDYEQQ